MDVSKIAEGVWNTIKGLPNSFYYGVRRTYISTGSLGYDRKLRNEKENERFYKVIRALLKMKNQFAG